MYRHHLYPSPLQIVTNIHPTLMIIHPPPTTHEHTHICTQGKRIGITCTPPLPDSSQNASPHIYTSITHFKYATITEESMDTYLWGDPFKYATVMRESMDAYLWGVTHSNTATHSSTAIHSNMVTHSNTQLS